MIFVCQQTILMKYHALFVIFENLKLSSAANYSWRFEGYLPYKPSVILWANSADPDAASDEGLICLLIQCNFKSCIRNKLLPNNRKIRNGFVHLIMVGNSIWH